MGTSGSAAHPSAQHRSSGRPSRPGPRRRQKGSLPAVSVELSVRSGSLTRLESRPVAALRKPKSFRLGAQWRTFERTKREARRDRVDQPVGGWTPTPGLLDRVGGDRGGMERSSPRGRAWFESTLARCKPNALVLPRCARRGPCHPVDSSDLEIEQTGPRSGARTKCLRG